MMSRGTELERIASEMGRTKAAIQAKLRHLQIERNGPPPKAPKRHERRKNGASFFLS
jgi:hypothetical protein